MKRQLRVVLITLVVAVLLGFGIIVMEATEKQQSHDRIVFRNSKPTDVRSIEISNKLGEISITFNESGYVMENVEADVININKFINLLTRSSAISAAEEIKKASNIEQYGFDDEVSSAYIEYVDGESLKILIGNKEPVSNGYYCMIEGQKNIYLFEKEQVDIFLQSEDYFISRLVTPSIPQQSQSTLGHVLAIELHGGFLEDSIYLTPVTKEDEQSMLDVISFGSATHLIEIQGLKHRVDQKYAEYIFDSIVGLVATDIISYNLSEEEINEFGFSEPSMTVGFDYLQSPDSEPVEYNIAVIEKNCEFYAICNDRGIIYRINPPAFYAAELEKFPVRWFFSPILFDVDAVEIKTGGDIYLFELSGTTNSDLAVKCNGEDFDLDRFRRLYKLLTSAAHDNTMNEIISIDSESDLQITYKYRNQNKEDDSISLYRAEARRYYVEANGITVFTIKEQFYARLIHALNVLFTDEEFEIEW